MLVIIRFMDIFYCTAHIGKHLSHAFSIQNGAKR